jgi:N-acetylmuramoyl-L-alanine amidase
MLRAMRSTLARLTLAFALGTASAAGAGPRTVVIDPGHGGPDHGARGPSGALEKELVLEIARELRTALARHGVRAVLTREEDRFVTLVERTEIANRARADLYLSIHANSAEDGEARGSETYFLSVEASDEEALRVAMMENDVFRMAESAQEDADVVGTILGDLIRTDHLRASSELAHAIQRELGRVAGPSRGVKQAPFVVLMDVNMPAALIEVGFLTHPEEERRLRAAPHRRGLAEAIARGVTGAGEAAAPAERGSDPPAGSSERGEADSGQGSGR